jgi:hypothetical protein
MWLLLYHDLVSLHCAKFAATGAVLPHAGHCIDDATAQYIVKAADPLDLAQKASHLHMDDYGPPPAPEPYRPGKNMVQPQAKGSRKDLFDVLRGRCVQSSSRFG